MIQQDLLEQLTSIGASAVAASGASQQPFSPTAADAKATATRGEIKDSFRRRVLAGFSIFTAQSLATGKHFTFRVKAARGSDRKLIAGLWFVGVLTGPNNHSDYTYIGSIHKGSHFDSTDWIDTFDYRHGRKTNISRDAVSAKAAVWLFSSILADTMPKDCQLYHEGYCCVCGKLLTDPESVASGIGPVCAGRE